MENDIALAASGYLLARLGILVAFGYLFYRVLRTTPSRARVRTRSDGDVSQRSRYAQDRYDVYRARRKASKAE